MAHNIDQNQFLITIFFLNWVKVIFRHLVLLEMLYEINLLLLNQINQIIIKFQMIRDNSC